MMETVNDFGTVGFLRRADADDRHLLGLAGGRQRGRRGADRLRHPGDDPGAGGAGEGQPPQQPLLPDVAGAGRRRWFT